MGAAIPGEGTLVGQVPEECGPSAQEARGPNSRGREYVSQRMRILSSKGSEDVHSIRMLGHSQCSKVRWQKGPNR